MSEATAAKRPADGSSGPLKYVILWFRLLFGAHLIYSAMRHFLGYEVLSRVPGLGGRFVQTLASELAKSVETKTKPVDKIQALYRKVFAGDPEPEERSPARRT